MGMHLLKQGSELKGNLITVRPFLGEVFSTTKFVFTST